jgi:hypothetical protein
VEYVHSLMDRSMALGHGYMDPSLNGGRWLLDQRLGFKRMEGYQIFESWPSIQEHAIQIQNGRTVFLSSILDHPSNDGGWRSAPLSVAVAHSFRWRRHRGPHRSSPNLGYRASNLTRFDPMGPM